MVPGLESGGNLGAMSFANVRRSACRAPHADLETLRQRFDALAEDRKKAQDIMEFQLRQNEESRGKAG